MRKNYALFGTIAPVIYLVAVIVGGFLRTDYSHLSDTISELTAAGAPNAVFLNGLFSAYNVLLLLFGAGASMDDAVEGSRKYQASTILLTLAGALGLLFVFFPQDPRGTPITPTGTIHILIAGILSPVTIATLLLVYLHYRQHGTPADYRFTTYTLVSDTIILISGLLAAISIGQDWPVGGLFERITIGAFLQWVVAFAWKLLHVSPSIDK